MNNKIVDHILDHVIPKNTKILKVLRQLYVSASSKASRLQDATGLEDRF